MGQQDRSHRGHPDLNFQAILPFGTIVGRHNDNRIYKEVDPDGDVHRCSIRRQYDLSTVGLG